MIRSLTDIEVVAPSTSTQEVEAPREMTTGGRLNNIDVKALSLIEINSLLPDLDRDELQVVYTYVCEKERHDRAFTRRTNILTGATMIVGGLFAIAGAGTAMTAALNIDRSNEAQTRYLGAISGVATGVTLIGFGFNSLIACLLKCREGMRVSHPQDFVTLKHNIRVLLNAMDHREGNYASSYL